MDKTKRLHKIMKNCITTANLTPHKKTRSWLCASAGELAASIRLIWKLYEDEFKEIENDKQNSVQQKA